jgi:hypothetical protein
MIHPKEVFLFTTTKVATGLSNQLIVDMYIGSDYARWSYAYPWIGTRILSGIKA